MQILLAAAAFGAATFLMIILGYVIVQGAPALNVAFFTERPLPFGVEGGGVGPAVVGSVVLSVLAGLIVGSYLGAPIGAEATVCDTRWPLIGLTGLVIATSTGQGTLAAHLFTGAAPVVLAGVIQPAFALLSLALLGWALRERLKLERTALTPSTGGDAGDVCTTCRPLFPTKAGTSRGPST